jgi:coenzyme PQQ biosynthesis protein PqqD
VVKLNATAAAVLHLCNGTLSVGEMTAILEERYAEASLGRDVAAFLARAAREGWIE